jgi:hypothetical protein
VGGEEPALRLKLLVERRTTYLDFIAVLLRGQVGLRFVSRMLNEATQARIPNLGDDLPLIGQSN